MKPIYSQTKDRDLRNVIDQLNIRNGELETSITALTTLVTTMSTTITTLQASITTLSEQIAAKKSVDDIVTYKVNGGDWSIAFSENGKIIVGENGRG